MENRILVVDDESQILRVLRRHLSGHQFEVHVASDGETAIDTFLDFPPDIVITDLQMPGMNGIDFCKEVRKISEVPIIVLSVKGQEEIKVAALDAGADDYITKPFGMDELMARIRAALRRVPPKEEDEKKIELGVFSVDLEAYSVSVRGRRVHLTPKEYELLNLFLQNDGKVLTHRKILSAIWGANSVEQSEYLRVFVGNLRKKIERTPTDPQYIQTEPWVGYRFSSDGN